MASPVANLLLRTILLSSDVSEQHYMCEKQRRVVEDQILKKKAKDKFWTRKLMFLTW